ncbi:hypothetical protein Trydic_g1659 [Trypoxylus dichotomus]
MVYKFIKWMQSDLDEDIYLEQPEGFTDGTDRICKLNRLIYGLKQSGRVWNIKLENLLKSTGLEKSKIDPCLYFNEERNLILAIYVDDDILIFWKDFVKLQQLKEMLSSNFKMNDMGEAKNCIGIRITEFEDGIGLDQSAYVKEILSRFGMSDCKPSSTPSDPGTKLSKDMQDTSKDAENTQKIPYQEAVGCLLYLAQGTRPDIAFAVNDVSRFNTNFNLAHWKAVKRIFRYLKGTLNYKLRYKREENSLIGYTDSDWASDVDNRRSCTGFVYKLSSAAISWNSRRQSTVALSSAEPEYMVLSSPTQEAIWLKQFEAEIDEGLNSTVKIYCDSQSAGIANLDGYRPRSKHIDIRHHYVREKLYDKTIQVEHLPTDEMIADNLTKAVSKHKHDFCSKSMGLC